MGYWMQLIIPKYSQMLGLCKDPEKSDAGSTATAIGINDFPS
jgi:hypothetical protein